MQATGDDWTYSSSCCFEYHECIFRGEQEGIQQSWLRIPTTHEPLCLHPCRSLGLYLPSSDSIVVNTADVGASDEAENLDTRHFLGLA